MTTFILNPIVDVSFLETYSFGIIGVSLILTLGIEYWTFRKIKLESMIDLVILAPLLYMAPLFISFVVYFGFWHALPSMRLEYEFLNRFPQYNSLLKFAKQLIPFTLLSLVGISGLLLFGMRFLDQSELLLLFFYFDLLNLFSPCILHGSLHQKIQNCPVLSITRLQANKTSIPSFFAFWVKSIFSVPGLKMIR